MDNLAGSKNRKTNALAGIRTPILRMASELYISRLPMPAVTSVCNVFSIYILLARAQMDNLAG